MDYEKQKLSTNMSILIKNMYVHLHTNENIINMFIYINVVLVRVFVYSVFCFYQSTRICVFFLCTCVCGSIWVCAYMYVCMHVRSCVFVFVCVCVM